ncbi:hypothetical protein HRI_003814600 [Hibiscus trionum]|uniref:BHLH domain-containing protein n=1 Tax=Hibiscus trionum TaxID=183268 RepID=A0A9W7IV01_HIBTR|nr:hypothetical protein HRI_003814600 [Hibiscus trionum]
METADYHYLQQNHHQQQQQSCGLMRYRSAPLMSLLENHVNGTTGVIGSGTGFDGYGDFRSSSGPEMEPFFMLSGNGSSVMQEYEEKSVKQEYQIQSLPMQSVGTDVGLENSIGAGNGNGSDLVRQSSSPARFFSNQGLDNGLCNNHISFSSMPSSYSKPMPRIARVEHRSLGGSNGSNGQFIPNLVTDSRNNASLSGLKRARESDGGDLFCGLSKLQTQNMDGRDCSTGLTHQFSLPKTYEEMDVVEKFWQFQGSVPCKIRAKRGCATHPRSIAERVRRTRISERMRKLQDLFPSIDKQTNTADMLDMAVEYIKDLQRQVKTLRDTKAKCSC